MTFFSKSFYRNISARINKNIARKLQFRALDQTCEYIETNMANIISFSTKYDLIKYALDQVSKTGLYLEFGVFKGDTINFIAKNIKQKIYGFDSFEGLPEFWRDGFDKGSFKINELPVVKNNVVLCKGWFDQTLPKFLETNKSEVAFLHVDCDLYSSTDIIFNFLGNKISPGTIILFDEYFNYPGWKIGEFKAFQEFIKKYNLKYTYLGYNRYSEQVAVMIN